MHTIIYSLKSIGGKSVLSIDLTKGIIDENFQQIHITLNGKEYKLNKSQWLNRDNIFDDGKSFLLVASKHRSRDYVFKVLMKYAISKIDSRIEYLKAVKETYDRELQVA